ncbi:N-acyl homoserine lactonase family protein [Subtercola vilae]|uniref:N-acyl homoserine lactonase family protein n=1 Tax=Subtercola vilae TaxID=2056433 RepID=A0A4T2BFG4_9MICO|nr:N-acyl homoserine lactonase family protein [Subtercola vilae]TIH29570.1 N-acyl homoserine lactonase family protein [Subtercola vilae]
MTSEQYEVVVVRHGTRLARRSEVFLNFGIYGDADRAHTVDYFFWIIRDEERTVLVDTGFAAGAAARRGRTVLVDPATAYRELGIDLDAPLDIVVTHAHYDHIGNLGLFANATIIVAEAELNFWASEVSTRPQIAHFTERDEVDALLRMRDEGRVRTFSGSLQLASGIEIIEVGGHTPGQSMLTVETSAGMVLLASDAVHFREELEREMPFVSVTDLVGMYKGFALVKRMLSGRPGSILLPGHDGDVLGTVSALEVGASSPLHGLVGSIGGGGRR